MSTKTIGEQIVAERIRDARATFIKLLLLNALAWALAIWLLLRG